MLNFYDRYISLNSIKPGATLQVRGMKPIQQYLNNQSIYDDLLAQSAETRYTLEALTTNLYAAVTNYFVENVWSSFPEGEIVNNNFINEFMRATWYRCLYGYGVVLFRDGRWECINSRFWWPVLVQGEKIGSAIVFPYQTPRNTFFNQQATATGATIPDRARVTLLLDKVNVGTIHNFHYTGITLGAEIPEERQALNQAALVVFGDGIRMFDSIEPLVLKYNDLINHTSNLIERFGAPHLQVPNSAVRNVNGVPQLHLDSQGSILPKGPNDSDYAYVTPTSEYQLFEFQATQVLGVISAITSVPLSNFNIHGLPRMESGAGIQELQAPATSKIALWRNAIANAVEFAGLGEIEWGSEVPNDPNLINNPSKPEEVNENGNESS